MLSSYLRAFTLPKPSAWDPGPGYPDGYSLTSIRPLLTGCLITGLSQPFYFSFVCLFLLFNGHSCNIWTFLGQGQNPNSRCDLRSIV